MYDPLEYDHLLPIAPLASYNRHYAIGKTNKALPG